jgi:elongator complex protein 4
MAASKGSTSSFQRRGARALPLGTVPSRQNAQLLVSTGVRSLDAVLGGGLAVGATMMLQEDTHRMYSRTVLKLFLSEGLACGHGQSHTPSPTHQHTLTSDHLSLAASLLSDHTMCVLNTSP